MDTIFSLVTKNINQNIGIIRVSGPETLIVIQEIFSLKKEQIKPNTIIFKELHWEEKFIDHVILLIFKGPNSFTGEDVVEIQYHGSIFLTKKIEEILLKFKLRRAERGEFTKRAFLNGKIDLTQSESINLIINAENELIQKSASNNLNGIQNKFINETIDFFENIIARVQLAIDYPENKDLPEYNFENITEELKAFLEKINKILISSEKLIKTSDGVKIGIIGEPNVGKSSLFNALLNEDKAIVSDIKGTTRDVVEAQMYLSGIKVTFQDTAGIRESEDIIEKEGIKKSFKILDEADIVLFLLDSSKNIEKQIKKFSIEFEKYNNKIIKILNKSDLIKVETDSGEIRISAKNNEIFSLINYLEKHISENMMNFNEDESILISNSQLEKFKEIKFKILGIIEMVSGGYPEDILYYEFNEIIKKLYVIIGKEIDEDYFTNLFKDFCIGK